MELLTFNFNIHSFFHVILPLSCISHNNTPFHIISVTQSQHSRLFSLMEIHLSTLCHKNPPSHIIFIFMQTTTLLHCYRSYKFTFLVFLSLSLIFHATSQINTPPLSTQSHTTIQANLSKQQKLSHSQLCMLCDEFCNWV